MNHYNHLTTNERENLLFLTVKGYSIRKIASIIYRPELQVYISEFGTSQHDIALVAEINGEAVGAVWVRIMNDYGHVPLLKSVSCMQFAKALESHWRSFFNCLCFSGKTLPTNGTAYTCFLRSCFMENVEKEISKLNE